MTDPLGLIRSTPAAGVQPRAGAAAPADGQSFHNVLMDNIQQVNKLQQDAERAIEDLVAGRRDDVTNVMIAKNKADLAFQMLIQVRGKMVAAYEEIKQMRV